MLNVCVFKTVQRVRRWKNANRRANRERENANGGANHERENANGGANHGTENGAASGTEKEKGVNGPLLKSHT